MRRGPARRRNGFTLIELVITIIMLSVLGGIALPTLRAAVFRAHAAKVATDVAAVRAAVFQLREDTNGLPRTARWRTVPPDLATYLNNVPFVYQDLEYRLVTNARRGRVDLRIRYPRGSTVGAALQRYRRSGSDAGSVTWTARQTIWRLLEDNQ